MPTLYDIFKSDNIVGYIQSREYTVNDAFLGSALFPAQKQAGLSLAWLRDTMGLDIALMPSTFDAKAELRDRIGVSTAETEMAFFKEAMRIGERDRQQLLMIKNEEYVQPIIARIYDDIGNLVRGVEVQAERMRMQLLSTGRIAISRNGAAYDYDYNFPTEHMDTISVVAKKWSATDTASPLDDIDEWVETIQLSGGIKPTRAICSPLTWSYLRKNESILKGMNPVTYATARMTAPEIRRYIFEQTGVVVEVYDKMYKPSFGAAGARYFPDNVFTLIPEGILGNTWFGTTPEEADLMDGNGTSAQVSLVGTGIAVTTVKESDPVNVNTKVSAVLLPTLPTIESIFIANVA